MTTIAAPQERTPRVLLAAAGSVLASTGVTVGIGALASGRTAAVSALLGGGIVMVFFAFGSLVVSTAAHVTPQAALLVAMVTYTLQVALVALIFSALTSSDAFDRDLSAGWLAAALIAGTFAWMAGQLIATLRAPIPAWEVDAA